MLCSADPPRIAVDLLELLFVVRRIPAWSTNLTTRAVATPKLMVEDSVLERASSEIVAVEAKAAEMRPDVGGRRYSLPQMVEPPGK